MGKRKTKNQKGAGRIWSFEVPPAPIQANAIKETVDTDVVVVGAGSSGLPAAISAAEIGAKTILLEKHSKTEVPGFEIGALGSKLQKKMGIEIDREEIVRRLVTVSEGRADERLIRIWANRSGEVVDWLINIADAQGVACKLEGPTTHMFGDNWQKDAQLLNQVLTKEALRKGVVIRYKTPAVRLLRPRMKGRVTGVIAKNENGEYIQFNVSKAVVLCAGDYGRDTEMVEKFCPWAADVPQQVTPETNTGDGHKMALWIGAAIEEAPHGTMIQIGESLLPIPRPIKDFLCVNKFGKRFIDESLSIEFISRNVIRQPDRSFWEIFDRKYVEDKYKTRIQSANASGSISNGNTIEELASKIGADGKELKATIDRYNELVRLGKDLDFGKSREYLTAIDKPPFYACKAQPAFLTTLGGLKRNTEGQVLDTNWDVIPGLYAAGNTAGGFFGDTYPIGVLSGTCRGHAVTFGRIAGLHAASA